MDNPLFRQEALERVSSPEQLDRLMRVTRPAGWIALIALAAVVVTAVVWSVWGTVPTRVQGGGILFGSGGAVVDVQAKAGGRVLAVLVRAGDGVTQGQAVARVERQDLVLALRQAEAYVRELKAQRDESIRYYDTYLQSQAASLAAQAQILRQRERDVEDNRRTARKNFQLRERDAEERLARLENLLRGWEELARQGFIPKIQVDQTRDQIASVQETLGQIRYDAQQLETSTQETLAQVRTSQQQLNVRLLEMKNQQTQALDSYALKLVDAEQKVAQLTHQLQEAAVVVAPVTGTIFETVVEAGAIVSDLAVIARVASGTRGIEALVYVPADRGKEVRVNHAVQVVPSTVKKEEYGFILARVEAIGELPVSPEALQAALGNRELAGTFLASGPKIAVTVDLLESASTPSGYTWSSGRGPDTTISRGTLASAEIIVREQPPITLVIPAFKKFFGLL
jgi:HlyD family secretion protein